MKKIFKLENLIYLTILALPSYLIKIRLFGLPSNFLELLIIINMLFWLIFYIKKINLKTFISQYKAIIFFTSVIFLGLIISIITNKNYLVGLGIFKAWFFLPVIFILIVNSVIDKNRRVNIFLAYYLSAFLVAISALVYFALGKITYDARLSGIFNSPNYLAMYLVPALFVAYYELFLNKIKYSKIFTIFSVIIISLVIYLTYSYASWFSLFMAFGIVFLLEKKFTIKRIFLSILIILILFSFQQEKYKFRDLFGLNPRSSFSSRLMIWRSAEKILQDNWFLGIGAGNFQIKYLEYQKYFPFYLEWAVPHPHNLYLTFWLYSGIFGLVGFLGLIIFWLKLLFKNQTKTSLKFMGLGIMIYLLLHGLVDTTYFKNDLSIIFWLLFALI